MRINVKKIWLPLSVLVVLIGCTTSQPSSVPVVDASSPLANKPNALETDNTTAATSNEPVAQPIPQGAAEPIQAFAADGTAVVTVTEPVTGTDIQPVVIVPPSGIPSTDSLSGGDKPLDGAVAALLTTAQQQQEAGNLNESAASIERAQRIAPSEPRVLYSLAVVRLKQGDAAASEQLARRALSYTASDQVELRSNLWELIALAREQQGDQAGANQARQQKQVRI